MYGGGPHIEIPGPRLALIIPATYVAVATFAISAAAFLGLEIVIFFARAVDPRVRIHRLERAAERERKRLTEDARRP
jgi:hypothetical protein